MLWLSGILAVSAMIGAAWLCSIPFQQAPDEAAHFQVVRFIRDFGRLPLFAPNELWLLKTQQGAVESYATFPPLAYIVSAVVSVLFRDHTLWPARLVSLGAYLGTVGMIYVIGRQLFATTRSVAVSASLFVAFLPQFAFTGAYVNDDALAVFECSLLIYVLLRLRGSGQHTLDYPAIGAIAGTLLLTKYTFYAAAGVCVAAAALVALRNRMRWRNAGALGLGLALCSAWWFARNWQLYGELIPSQVVARAKELAGGNSLFVPINHGITLLTLSTQTDFWPVTLKSFVACFGYLQIWLDPGFYAAVLGSALLAVVGIALRVARGSVTRSALVISAVGIIACLATLGATMVISVYGEYSPQGRYLFAALVPLALALAAGWRWLGESHRWLTWLPTAIVGGFLALNLVSLLVYVVPHHFNPSTDSVIVEIDQPAGTVESKSDVEILGWSLAQGSADWRPYSPEVVDTYRQPVDAVVVYLDGAPGVGTYLGRADYGFQRKDVSDFFGGDRRLRSIGYRFVIPGGTISPGTHELDVCGTAATLPAPVCRTKSLEAA